jgi:hypothetical protein
MIMNEHQKYKYSVTIQTDDLPVVNCLRALSQYSQKTGNNRITWGNTKDKDWDRDNHCVTFRFTSPEYREGFLSQVNRLLPNNLWREYARSDNNPAKPAR